MSYDSSAEHVHRWLVCYAWCLKLAPSQCTHRARSVLAALWALLHQYWLRIRGWKSRKRFAISESCRRQYAASKSKATSVYRLLQDVSMHGVLLCADCGMLTLWSSLWLFWSLSHACGAVKHWAQKACLHDFSHVTIYTSPFQAPQKDCSYYIYITTGYIYVYINMYIITCAYHFDYPTLRDKVVASIHAFKPSHRRDCLGFFITGLFECTKTSTHSASRIIVKMNHVVYMTGRAGVFLSKSHHVRTPDLRSGSQSCCLTQNLHSPVKFRLNCLFRNLE